MTCAQREGLLSEAAAEEVCAIGVAVPVIKRSLVPSPWSPAVAPGTSWSFFLNSVALSFFRETQQA